MKQRDDNKIVVKLEGLSIGYQKSIYNNIEASAKRGEIIAIIGANGAGKSTLLKSISGSIPFQRGSITLFGEKSRGDRAPNLKERVSFVPAQGVRAKNFSLFDMLATSCYNRTNWIGATTKEDEELIYSVLKRVGLENFENRDISTLSDGEFQRATFATALVQKSHLILLDEPTAFLDIENKIAITKLLREITHRERKSLLFSTHDLHLAIQNCDKIWIMGHSNFIEGEPTQLIEKGAFDLIFKDSSLKFDKQLLTFS